MNTTGITSLSIRSTDQSAGLELPNGNLNNTAVDRRDDSYNFLSSINTANETKQLIDQLDQLFGYRKELSLEQKKQVNHLFAEIDKVLQSNAISGPSPAQETELDKLFDEIDNIYQARSYESLSSQEQHMVDNLLDQLEVTLA